MDGPHVNWSMYDKVAEKRAELEKLPELISFGSCSLHIVHGAFGTGHDESTWGIKKLLKIMHYMFKDMT